MALTGPLAANGKQALLGMKIWEEETNAKGGLLGRPVKLVYYDDQSQASPVPGIYTKLHRRRQSRPRDRPLRDRPGRAAMPVIMQKGKLFIILFGLDVNNEFKYPKFFAMIPTGPNTKPAFTEGFFEVAVAQNPEAADRGARRRRRRVLARTPAKARGRTPRRPASRSSTTRPIRRPPPTSRRSSAPSRRPTPMSSLICSYPLDSVGMVKAVNEVGFKPKMIGGAMVGLQATVFKNQLGPLLNGWINYETWVPSKKMMLPADRGVPQELPGAGRRRRRRSARLLPRRLGLRLHPGARRRHRGHQEPRTTTSSPTTSRKTTFKTIMGDIKFGQNGEWEKGRMLQVQYHGIKKATDSTCVRAWIPDRADAARPQDRQRRSTRSRRRSSSLRPGRGAARARRASGAPLIRDRHESSCSRD